MLLSPKSREEFHFTTYKTEPSSFYNAIPNTYVMTTINHLINFLSSFFTLASTHLLCLIFRLQILGARVIYLFFIHTGEESSIYSLFIQHSSRWASSSGLCSTYRWEINEDLLTPEASCYLI